MTVARRFTFTTSLTLLLLTALSVAACGGSGGATAAPAPPKTTSGRATTVGVASTTLEGSWSIRTGGPCICSSWTPAV